MVKKGSFVQIKVIVLKPSERSKNIPDDTKNVPFVMWIKGILQEDAELGQQATIMTETHRIETGTLIEVNPAFKHGFGDYVEALNTIKEIISLEMEDVS
jgi:2-amino-4-ketopentanoate thiolase alpha subunit